MLQIWPTSNSYVPMILLGEVKRAIGVGQVIESRVPEFNPGDFVQGWWGWQDYIATASRVPKDCADAAGYSGGAPLPCSGEHRQPGGA
jgi:NADPH-dependent curcumin reductase CurA